MEVVRYVRNAYSARFARNAVSEGFDLCFQKARGFQVHTQTYSSMRGRRESREKEGAREGKMDGVGARTAGRQAARMRGCESNEETSGMQAFSFSFLPILRFCGIEGFMVR